jgi:hypothetical protein
MTCNEVEVCFHRRRMDVGTPVGGLRGGTGCEMTCNEVCFHRRRMDADTVTTVVVGLRGGRAVLVINTGTLRRSMHSPGGSNSGRRTASTALVAVRLVVVGDQLIKEIQGRPLTLIVVAGILIPHSLKLLAPKVAVGGVCTRVRSKRILRGAARLL